MEGSCSWKKVLICSRGGGLSSLLPRVDDKSLVPLGGGKRLAANEIREIQRGKVVHQCEQFLNATGIVGTSRIAAAI